MDREKRIRLVYTSYRYRANDTNKEFDLSYNRFKELIIKPCVYCGGYNMHSLCGVDRIDNKRGYTKDNCVSCCGICNRMKRELGFNAFKEHVIKIYRHLNRE